MARVLEGYEPKAIYEFFEEISAIPRGSGNEKGIADHMVAFAEARGLEVYRDSLNNVLIKKPAAPGFEDHAPVIIQGHLDMVCEKLAGVQHDFTKDPIEMYVENGILRARGTTLGADDGVAVAYMMALLDDKDLPAPALECLFTTEEEVGMGGAMGFDYSRLSGRVLLNIDSGTVTHPTVSCAGSAYAEILFPMKRSPNALSALAVSVKGLAGGHSGGKIHLGLTNANLLLARLLFTLYDEAPFALHSFTCAGKNNAIARAAEAVICVPDARRAREILQRAFETAKKEMVDADSGAELSVKETGAYTSFSRRDTRVFLEALLVLPNGVMTRVPAMPSLVETSCNIGIVETEEGGIRIKMLARSSSESRLDELLLRLKGLASLVEGEYSVSTRHPGWEFAKTSRLREIYAEVLEKTTGEKPVFQGVHAGLECGIFCQHLPGLEAVSFGSKHPNAHTPDECLDLESYSETFAFLKALLAAL